jgi:signal transduction histidine kinase
VSTGPRLRDSAAYRIAFTYSAAFALATIALGAVVYLVAHAAFIRQLDERIAADSAELVRSHQDRGYPGLRAAIAARETGGRTNELGYALFDAGGRRVAGSLQAAPPPPGRQNITFSDPLEGDDRARALAVDLGDGTRLVVAADLEALERMDSTILVLFGSGFLVVIAIGVGGALLLGGYLRTRIGGLGAAAEAIISGDLTQRMPVGPRDDEFDRLSRTLNTMLDRIAGLMDNLRQVSGDVAHDLRTPLARLRNHLEGALAAPQDRASQREALQDAIKRTDDVLALFAAILRISEVEGGGVRRSFRNLDLSDLVTELCESYAPACEDGSRRLSWAVERDVAIVGDRELVAQAIINLLENAQLHTPPGSRIHVHLGRQDREVTLAISDNGPGVAVADRERVIRRFTRLEASRTTPGQGLGLNLVTAIATAHDARLVLGDNRPGLVATLVFRRPE